MNFFSNIPNVLNFNIYGKYHLIVLSIILLAFILTIIFRMKLRNWNNEKVFKIAITVFAILVEFSYKIWAISAGKGVLRTIFSLDLCSISLWMAWILMFTNNKKVFSILYFFSFGALSALLFPDIVEFGPDHFRFYQFFFVHGYIMWVVVYYIAVNKYSIKFKDYIRSIVVLIPGGLVIFLINLIFKVNFMFLREKPSASSPIDLLGPWPIYVFGLVILAFIIFFIAYIPWLVINVVKKKQEVNSNILK